MSTQQFTSFCQNARTRSVQKSSKAKLCPVLVVIYITFSGAKLPCHSVRPYFSTSLILNQPSTISVTVYSVLIFECVNILYKFILQFTKRQIKGLTQQRKIFLNFFPIKITVMKTTPLQILPQFFKLINNPMDYYSQSQTSCQSPLGMPEVVALVVLFCVSGLIWAFRNVRKVTSINMGQDNDIDLDDQDSMSYDAVTPHQKKLLLELGSKISEGAKEFLKQQYLICMIFVAVMYIVIVFLTPQKFYTANAFLIGAIISIISGSVGMAIATSANFRTTFAAKRSLSLAFKTAYRAGVAMGFALVSLGLLVLIILIMIYKSMLGLEDRSFDKEYFGPLFEAIAGYGLGGSFVALFGRVGGGIYTKAADVGADLVGKVQKGLPEDSPKNPATIADNVGDNVGDVAGMSADLFGSFAESTCAALVLSSTSLVGIGKCQFQISNFMFPLTLIAFGIFICIFVSALSTDFMQVNTLDKVQKTLKYQLIISTIVLIGAIALVAYISYPDEFKMKGLQSTVRYYHPYICAITGLISGLFIAAFTQYVTSHSYKPVRELAKTCRAGAASNVTLGLALGYMSTSLPVIFIALTAYISNHLLGYYGVSIAALGMLSNLPLSLAIDGYGPISDNAGGIAEMAEMGPQVRNITDGLDAAGNTTAAIGKGFAIGSAALVALSLYGGFLHNAKLQTSNSITLTKPDIFAGLLIGAMLPYLFSAFTIKSVGKAAFGMVEQVRRQIRCNPGILQGTSQPDYKACIRISTRSSLKQMIAPGILVIFSPLALGFIFGPVVLAGFLPGAIVSGVQMAVSAANTGGAWDNAKKYIESGAMFDEQGNRVLKGSQIHKAAVVGDTVGDPLKDTSGPALNILVKLMAIISLIFASKFEEMHRINQ